MSGVSKHFSPSVNIGRDIDKDFDYVVTSNARQIYNQLVGNVDSGTHSFTIIGSYGTGKSSFLVAFRKNLIGDTHYFETHNGEFEEINSFEFDYIVGNYGSLLDELIEHFDLDSDFDEKQVLDWIDKRHKKLKDNDTFWFLVIDEFGKHLEYAAKENPEKELYFVQLLSEYANEESKNLFFITTLHQAFDSYAHGLDAQQRKEWDKVRGRLKELTFNEPVEQLLHIASEYLKNGQERDLEELQIPELLKCIESSQAFPLKNELDLELAENLYPLEPMSASVLALALQKYGQNERSLFTFLQSDEFLGVNNFDTASNPYYNLGSVYDYLIYNYHSYISSKYNPHFVQWNAIKKALERVESIFEEEVTPLKKIVKQIGLLNIFASEGAKIDREFLVQYSRISVGIDNTDELIDRLEKKQIIRYRSYKGQYILFEGTDFDIEYELQQATSKVDPIKDIVTHLRKHFDFPYLPAKRIYYKKGTPRFFEFKLSEEPIEELPNQPIDGYINLVFNVGVDEVKVLSEDLDSPILYGVFKNTAEIEDQLFLIQKTRYLLRDIDDDKIAERELRDLLDAQIEDLNDLILENIYGARGELDWVFQGDIIDIHDSKTLNNSLSDICEEIYSKTPVFRNELVNKYKVSPAIYRPRKILLQKLLEDQGKEFLGYEKDKFPADKTIYLSLLRNTGIHKKQDGKWRLGEPDTGSGIESLWIESEKFFNSTKSGKRPLTDFVAMLKNPPLGLKDGFIEIWLPTYLVIKNNDYALFQEEAYIPELTYDVLNLVYRNPKLFEIKAYHISDVKKEVFSKYREYHNQDESAEFSNKSFVETIRPFLLVYNDLNKYGRKTSKISKPAQRLRDAIKTATEPERAFFEEFPRALGYTNLDTLKSDKAIKEFVYQLDKCIDEIKNAYNQLIDRVERCLLESLKLDLDTDFEEYQAIIKGRYESIKSYKLVSYQKKLLGRLLSNLSDREKWISSVAFAILDKPLNKISDDEPILLDRLNTRIEELDNLRDLSSLNIDPEKQEIFKFKLQPFDKKPLDLNVVVEKNKIDQEKKRYEKLKEQLSNNKDINIALLLKLIEELQNNE